LEIRNLQLSSEGFYLTNVTDVISFQFTPSFLDGDEFRLMTYNLLADLYADSDFSRTHLHPQCPPYALAIDYRKQLLLKEILGFHADIMCLVSRIL
jgi:mRNA deadenylase 3'-5' endonuclease subunit Ccr4